MPYIKAPRLSSLEVVELKRILAARGWASAPPTNKFEMLQMYPPAKGFPMVAYYSKNGQTSLPDWALKLVREGDLLDTLAPMQPWTVERRIGDRIYPAGLPTAEELKSFDRHNLPEGVKWREA